jgi:hypothetical protein
MGRLIVVLLLLVSFAAEGAGWRESKNYLLKKDETAKVMIKSEGRERLLSFRWTLYTDKALIVHENFDRHVGQHVLIADQNPSFRKVLLSAKRTQKDVPYLLVVFKKFDEANATAQMDLLLFDKENRIVLDYLTQK